MTSIMDKMEEIQKMADDLGDMQKFQSYAKKDGEIDLVHCGSCEKMITPNLIASFGADHHDPDQTMCESCFAGAIDTAEARAETL
jgi:MinD superfamily P-loop ATPase